MIIHSYIIEENLCFLTLTEKSVSKRVIFGFLEDIKNTFIAYVQNEHKEEQVVYRTINCRWRTVLATMARPYAFARFGITLNVS